MKIKFFLCAVLGFYFAISIGTTLFAHETLKPPLVNIPGWQAEEAQSMDMSMGGTKMINAVRSYEKGNNTFEVNIVITILQMALASFQEMEISQEGVVFETTQMDGFKVMHTHDSIEKSGSIMILLGETATNSAFLSLTYEGLSHGEGIALAKKFDWKNIQKAAKALME